MNAPAQDLTEDALRQQVIATSLAMNALGINQGKSGNVSARFHDGYLITPTGLPYDQTKSEDIVFMRQDQPGDTIRDEPDFLRRAPSSEWRFHRDIYARYPDVNAIVHTHSVHAAALACLRRSIPAFHYMVAVAGGRDIRCAPYATFGTQQLSDNALGALQDRKACLLANHGAIATGPTLAQALDLAVEVETLAHMYLLALQIGEPALLGDEEMAIVVEKFLSYGRAPRP